jgi:hypothetical protein
MKKILVILPMILLPITQARSSDIAEKVMNGATMGLGVAVGASMYNGIKDNLGWKNKAIKLSTDCKPPEGCEKALNSKTKGDELKNNGSFMSAVTRYQTCIKESKICQSNKK